ncbi:uncharacterized protein CFAP97D1 isoform X1 [Xyrichtys novacula]|uniref:Uncharacterized protein CFAP97D1 isoform X1 n=1 Tax=Xyrichtys novacula TaxID=13765 RepID=A0AAV1H2N5_XYRNO|nr:uncharacterized protein CFAP97D1 isoform X1 [Xyrichtys novacula]
MTSPARNKTGGPQSARTSRTHLAYQPVLPCANKYLQYRWDKASYDLHREKVKSIKSVIKIPPLKTYVHEAHGLMKQRERISKIERENSIISDKISHIKKTTGGVDNWNYYTKISPNKEKKQQEQLCINKENQKMLSRLNHCRPTYDVGSWLKDWHKHLKLIDSISRYPRGSANQLKKGQEKSTKESSVCHNAQKICQDAAAHSTTSMSEKKEERGGGDGGVSKAEIPE